jgi:hypothetical protein
MATTYYNPNPENVSAHFDVNKFNKDFDDYLAKDKARREVTEQKYLDAKTVVKREKLLHELTFFELMVNMKNAFFDILGEIVAGNIDKETFVKNNRLFYLGSILLIFVVSLQCVNVIFD